MIGIFVGVLTELVVRVQAEKIGYLALVNYLSECNHRNHYEIYHIDYLHDEYSRRIYYATEVAQCPSEDYK